MSHVKLTQFAIVIMNSLTWKPYEPKTIIVIEKQNEIYICEAVCDAVQECSEVTRPSADCQTTIFRRFKQLDIFLKKVAERSRDSGREVTRPSADCQTTFFGRFKRFGKILKKVAERSRDSGRRSRDCRPTVKQRFSTFQAIRNFFEKSR